MKWWWGLAAVVVAVNGVAACPILDSNGRPTAEKHDALYATLSALAACPTSAPALKSALTDAGLRVQPSMVRNRGFHNPGLGSFSFFERVTGRLGAEEVRDGDFFFGHFTGLEGNRIVLDQTPDRGKLLVELIAFDYRKGLFNFYELIGTGTSGRWFYRGDSADALRDNRNVHLTPPPGDAKFGDHMRCSACHASGGPIMKELAAPHNDWWTIARPLPFGANRLSAEVERWMGDLADAKDFSASVRRGIDRLEASAGYAAAGKRRSLRERLRPLFCENEINLESAGDPLDDAGAGLAIPSASLVSPLLATSAVSFPKAAYRQLLQAKGLRFPETTHRDGDHPWLVPVKGYSDLLAIGSLVASGLVDDELVADVLAVDMGRPIFSRDRCALLSLVPPTATADWQLRFRDALRASALPAARELLLNLEDGARSRRSHQLRAGARLAACSEAIAGDTGRDALFEELLAMRQAAFDSEISKNPKGQILEPGFRVIFPVRR